VYTSGEADGFNTHCSALIAAATCKFDEKFVNNFKSYSKKFLAYFL